MIRSAAARGLVDEFSRTMGNLRVALLDLILQKNRTDERNKDRLQVAIVVVEEALAVEEPAAP